MIATKDRLEPWLAAKLSAPQNLGSMFDIAFDAKLKCHARDVFSVNFTLSEAKYQSQMV